jgi:hypothetical protein
MSSSVWDILFSFNKKFKKSRKYAYELILIISLLLEENSPKVSAGLWIRIQWASVDPDQEKESESMVMKRRKSELYL